MKQRKQTKIIATVSDRRCDVDFIRSLYDAGVNVVRLNTAHQSPEDTLRVVNNVRAVSEKIALLLDTKGPEVRTALDGEGFAVNCGDTVAIGDNPGTGVPFFATSYAKFVDDVPVGSSVLIDDGCLKLKVEQKVGGCLLCRACNAGQIGKRKSINVPGVHISLPSLSEKDRDYIRFAVENDIDFIAHSFVRNRDDVMAIQSILDTYNSPVKIIAKIENDEGVRNLPEILGCAYGVMVARGDLGVEIPLDRVPIIQKQIVRECIRKSKPVIIATQMLHSMIENPRPTRAEVSDIAAAVFDGTDAVMLSGETAYGKYPLESVEAMAQVLRTAEAERPAYSDLPVDGDYDRIGNYLARIAVTGALEMGAKVILCDTKLGFSVRALSSYRGHMPIIACTHDKRVQRELALSFGVHASYVQSTPSTDEMVMSEFKLLVEKNLIDADDLVLILASTPEKRFGANLLEFNTARECLGMK